MALVKFETTGKNKGKTVRIGSLIFEDGVLEVSTDIADNVENLVCRFHACTRDGKEWEGPTKAEVEQAAVNRDKPAGAEKAKA